MNTQGGINTMINNRGTGYGLTPDWQAMGETHGGMGVNGARASIRFGRLFGTGRPDVSISLVYGISCCIINFVDSSISGSSRAQPSMDNNISA
jgi:hypothetical protein